MSTTTPTDSATPSRLQTLDLDRITPREGFNPRRKRDSAAFAQLTASIADRGVLQPLLVTVDPEHDGNYLLVAGEGRYLAAVDVHLQRVPCLIDVVDPQTGGLDDALIENMIREDLTPIDQAHAFQRLKDTGRSVRQIAETVRRPRKFVRDRLALLKVPAELHDQIDRDVIPLGAVPALVKLAEIHPELPALAVRRVLSGPVKSWDAPTTFEDLTADPISVVIGNYEEQHHDLPDGVYAAGVAYPVTDFALPVQAQKHLTAYGALRGTDPTTIQLRFGQEMVDQALALHAAFPAQYAGRHLIVGTDVATQLVADEIKRGLKAARKQAKQERDTAAQTTKSPARATRDLPLTDEELREQRRQQRKKDNEARQHACAYNAVLGAELVRCLHRVKVDERVLKILTIVPLAQDLEKIAMRGARIAFPGWVSEMTRKNGTVKRTYLDGVETVTKARAYLDGASRAGEIAGRSLALIAAARWANEQGAVPQSRRSHYELPMHHYEAGLGVPWTREVGALLDEILLEKLSAEATEPIRKAQDQRAKRRTTRKQGRRQGTGAQEKQAKQSGEATSDGEG